MYIHTYIHTVLPSGVVTLRGASVRRQARECQPIAQVLSLHPSMSRPVGTVHFIAAKTRRKLVQTLGAASSQTSATRPAVGSSELHLAAPSCARHTVCIAEPEAELRLHPGWGGLPSTLCLRQAGGMEVKCLSTFFWSQRPDKQT
jgi:hypothetical protein